MKDKGLITLKYLQEYIRSKDFYPDRKKDYFMKLSEEVCELESYPQRFKAGIGRSDKGNDRRGNMGCDLLCAGACELL